MPAGVSWGQYLKFFTAAMFSMVAGAQLVHVYYNPMKDLNVYLDKEIEVQKIDPNLIKKQSKYN